jgi:hypothetical protein
MIFTKAFKIGGSEGTVSSSRVGPHCLTLPCRFGEARRRRERQARSDVLSLLVTYLPQRSSSVALRALFSFARVGPQRRTLLSLVGGAHLRQEKQARSDMLFQLMPAMSSAPFGSRPLACVLWLASFGPRPLARFVLWLASFGSRPFGSRPLACVLWLALSFGSLCPLARILWLVPFGSRPLARVLWLASCGSRPLARVLWLASSGSRPLARFAFGSRPLARFVLWLASFGSRPLARVLWLASFGQSC